MKKEKYIQLIKSIQCEWETISTHSKCACHIIRTKAKRFPFFVFSISP